MELVNRSVSMICQFGDADEFKDQRIDSKDIIIAGHSLGTGVASQLAHRLTLEGTSSSLASRIHLTFNRQRTTRSAVSLQSIE